MTKKGKNSYTPGTYILVNAHLISPPSETPTCILFYLLSFPFSDTFSFPFKDVHTSAIFKFFHHTSRTPFHYYPPSPLLLTALLSMLPLPLFILPSQCNKIGFKRAIYVLLSSKSKSLLQPLFSLSLTSLTLCTILSEKTWLLCLCTSQLLLSTHSKKY